MTVGLWVLAAAVASSPAVRGVVIDAQTGAPAAGITVRLGEDRQTVSDERGAFAFEGVAAGEHRLEASGAGYDPVAHPFTAPASGEVGVLLAIGKQMLPGKLQGVAVYRPLTGPPLPIASARVLIAGRKPLTTDKEGRFSVEPIGPGPVSLKVRAAGYRIAEEVAVIPSGGTFELEVPLTPESDSFAILRGQVRSAGGQPVKATIRVLEAKITARAAEDGGFTIRINSGRYTVGFGAEGHVAQTKVVEVAPGDQALFYVDLAPER